MDIACPSCGAYNRPVAKYCGICGAQLPAQNLQIIPQKPASALPTQLKSAQDAMLVLPGNITLPLEIINTLGRDTQQCNLTFSDDERMSRQHIRIEQQNGQWMLADLNSANGTFVNNTRVSNLPVVLKSGDVIQAGRQVITFQMGGILSPPVGSQLPLSPGNSPIHLYSSQPPMGGWHQWKQPPVVEGNVEYRSERYSVKRDDLAKRGCLAVVLAVIVSPVLAFLPFLQGHDLSALDFRVKDYQSGKLVDVQVRGELLGNINQGDVVAMWCKNQNGQLILVSAYNYISGQNVGVKK